MKVKTIELIAAALDWAVAKSEDEEVSLIKGQLETRWTENGWKPSTDWAQGGPIIEREGIDLYQSGCWAAEMVGAHRQEGPSPLVAAMRCYVASKLGDSVEIPAEFIKG